METPRPHVPARYWRMGGLLLVLALLPAVVHSSYVMTIMTFIGLYTLLTMGLCLLMGYAGQVSLGHAAFYGLGAYSSAIASTRYGLSPWLGLLLAMMISGGVAFVISRPIFTLRGHYLAMATLGFGYIVYIFFTEASGLTGGPSGLTGVPHLSILGWAFDRDVRYYYLVWGLVVLALACSLNIVNSRLGRGLRAIHSSEAAAQSLGVDVSRLKTQIFVLSAVYAGLAGGLYAHYVTFVNPSPFGFHLSVMLVVMASVGGVATVWGAPLGAAVVVMLTEILRTVMPRLLDHASGEYEIVAFGVLLMVVMIFMPQGVVQGLTEIYARRQGERRVSLAWARVLALLRR